MARPHPGTRLIHTIPGQAVFIVLWLTGAMAAFAVQPPPPGTLEQYRQDGSLAQRQAFAMKTGNAQVSPDLAKRKIAQLAAWKSGQKVGLEKFPYATGLPSKGTPRVFALLIDFPDYPHINAESLIASKLFGTGKAAERPYESLREYYRRSSYYYSKPHAEALDIQGDVLPWYRAKHNRSYYPDAETLIKEALNYHAATHNFAVYDNNGDGTIDFFMTFYTGPDTGWGSLWWGWESNFDDTAYTVSGKKLKAFCFEWESNPVGDEFTPHVVIHETGHGLGLPDLYDYKYDPYTSPPGGVGGLDMMDHNWGDHNGFSKWLLDWLTPTVISAGGPVQTITLRPCDGSPDAVVIMPGASVSNPFSEFFLVQNRSRGLATRGLTSTVHNDMDYPNNGLLVWHIDARLNAKQDNFAWNNSYTQHRLVMLMEADGKMQIYSEEGADAGDYYTPQTYFSGNTFPSSRDYTNTPTGVSVFNIAPVAAGRGFIPACTYSASFLISSGSVLSIGQAVENPAPAWISSGSKNGAGWFGQTQTSYYAGNAAQSLQPGDAGHSDMGTTITGPTTLSFYWKVSSEKSADFLDFSIDGTVKSQISGEVNWTRQSYAIPNGPHYVQWKYSKNASGSAGGDCGWVDKVQGGPIPLGEALDNPPLTLAGSGAADWSGQDLVSYFGGSSAQSGPIGDGEESRFSAGITGPVTLKFYWKVSSEQNGDFLQFLLDGAVQSSISGEADWKQVSVAIPAGTHQAAWRYIKNTALSQGADCGWVDLVTCSDPQLGDALENTILPWSISGNASWTYSTTGAYNQADGADRLVCRTTPNTTSTGTLTTTVVGPGTISFWWKDSDPNFYSSNILYRMYIDDQYGATCLSSQWKQATVPIPLGRHDLHWSYTAQADDKPASGSLDLVVWTPAQLNLNEAVDNFAYYADSSSSPSSAFPWTPELDATAYGLDAARSGAIGNNQKTTMTMTINGPALLDFKWKVSSQAGDNLAFLLDGVEKNAVSGTVLSSLWLSRSFVIPPGSHTLAWQYAKDASGAAGSDCGWVDKVTLTPLPTLAQALDNQVLGFTTNASSTAGQWVGQPLTSIQGGSSAQSGPIVSGQNSTLATSITGPGKLRFYWKVSCKPTVNFLAVSVGQSFALRGSGLSLVTWQEAARISGYNTQWAYKELVIPSGSHLVRWQYVKTTADTVADGGWVDKVEFIPPAGAEAGWVLYP